MPIEEYDYVVLDTELTGMNKQKDEIVSVGAVLVKNLQIMAGHTFYTLVRPGKINVTDATLIHQITPQELYTAPPIQDVLPGLLDFCGSSFLVGHYIDLDTRFINNAAKIHFGSTIKTPCLDTLRLAQIYREKVWGRYHDQLNLQVSYNLTDLCKEYDLPLFPAHDALQDALQTAYLFLFLVKTLQKNGLVTLKDFFKAGQSWNRTV
ncbi:MAG: 3'-5' exonuclease [Desulfobulbaceae bacterium]|nr:3'-5' exonuclease [Desulfobulbaceae bacterium]